MRSALRLLSVRGSVSAVAGAVAQVRAVDHRGAEVGRDRAQQVVVDGAAVERADQPLVGVDGGRREVRHDPDALLVGDLGQDAVRVGLRERAGVRRDQRDLDAVADALLAEVVVGEERELERRDGALDRHLADVDDEPAFLHAGDGLPHRERPVERVERVHAAVAHHARHAFDLLRRRAAAERADQEIVGIVAVVGVHLALRVVDQHHFGRHEGDAARQRRGDRPDDVVPFAIAVHPERDEQEPRLVDVQRGLVDHRDLPLAEVEPVRQQVGRQRAAGAGAEDHDVLHGGACLPCGRGARRLPKRRSALMRSVAPGTPRPLDGRQARRAGATRRRAAAASRPCAGTP